MRERDEPVVALVDWPVPEPPGLSVADVAVVRTGHRHQHLVFADLFGRYPGLSMVVAPSPAADLVAALPDGTALVLRPAAPAGPACPLAVVAAALHQLWASGTPLSALSGWHLPVPPGSRFLIDAGRWETR